VAEVKYLGTTLTNQNDIHDEIKSRLNSGNACYRSVQNILSSRLISKNLKIKTYKTYFAYCAVWVRNLVFHFEEGTQTENRVLRRIFGPKREEDGSWIKLHNDKSHSLCSSPNVIGAIKSRRMRWAGHVARMGDGCSPAFGCEA
jgi:hypothetical protein